MSLWWGLLFDLFHEIIVNLYCIQELMEARKKVVEWRHVNNIVPTK